MGGTGMGVVFTGTPYRIGVIMCMGHGEYEERSHVVTEPLCNLGMVTAACDIFAIDNYFRRGN
jgi:hypothetical protein